MRRDWVQTWDRDHYTANGMRRELAYKVPP
jgi:hypothetical protein